MRPRTALLFVLVLLAVLAWLLVRARGHAAVPLASGVPVHELPSAAQLDRAPDVAETPATTARRVGTGETRFEPLPEEPSEIVVKIVDDATHQPVLGAEVFVLEVDDSDWPFTALKPDQPSPDVEAELRARGRKLESDAQGELHLPIPSACLAVMARKGELFGEMAVSFESLPEAILRLHHSSVCLVRIRDGTGRAVGGEPLILSSERDNRFWRGLSDDAGEVHVPNLGWLIAERCDDSGTWLATVDDACAASPTRWFPKGDPPPTALELVVGEAQRVHLRVAASDGTLVPIDGFIDVTPARASGSTSLLRLPRGMNPQLRLVRGSAFLARGEPGGWLDLDVELAGNENFGAPLHVPARGEASGELTLRMPEKIEVLILHPTDEQGAPIARQEFEWISWAQAADDELEMDQRFDRVHSDEQGVLALAFARREFSQDPEDRSPLPEYRGILRVRGSRELESAPIPYAALARGAVHDLGTLKLAPATPLVRGHVVDDRGRPLAHVHVGLEQRRVDEGFHEIENLAGVETQSGALTGGDGAFTIHGSCPGGRLQLNLTRKGHLPTRGLDQGSFECGSSPDLHLVMDRCAELATSVRAPKHLDRLLEWRFDDGRPESLQEQIPPDASGFYEHTYTGFLPGTYRVSLAEVDSDAPPIVQVENVVLRPGMRTLDPRLLDIDLARYAAGAPQPASASHAKPIELRILDSNGRTLPDGRLVEQYGDFHSLQEWHGGRVIIQPNMLQAYLAIWSPGRLAWRGPCPEQSGELRLEPAPLLRVKVQIPPELRQHDWHFRVEPSVVGTDELLWDIAKPIAPAEVDSDGTVAFEIPGEFTIGLSLLAYVLDPSGTSYREGTAPHSVAYITLEVPSGDEVHVLTPKPELWAAAEKALDGKH